MEKLTNCIIHLNLPSAWKININGSQVHIFEKDEIHEITKTDMILPQHLYFVFLHGIYHQTMKFMNVTTVQ